MAKNRVPWKKGLRNQTGGTDILVRAAPGENKRLGITKIIINPIASGTVQLHWAAGVANADYSVVNLELTAAIPVVVIGLGDSFDAEEGPDNVALYLDTDGAVNVKVYGYTEEDR